MFTVDARPGRSPWGCGSRARGLPVNVQSGRVRHRDGRVLANLTTPSPRSARSSPRVRLAQRIPVRTQNRSGTETWSRWLRCRLPCRSILDLDRPPSEADHRSQLPKLMALYPNSLISLWIRLRHDPFEARPLTERDRWTGSDLEWQLLVWQCCSPDAHRRSAMPMWDRTPAAASTPAQTLMWDRSTRRRSTKARSWQNGLDDR